MSLFGSAGSFSGLCVNNFVRVRWDCWWWIVYDNICAYGRERAVRVEHYAVPDQVGTVFEPFDFVNHAFISKLGI